MLLIDDVTDRIRALKTDKLHARDRLKLLCQSEGVQRTDINNIAYFKYVVGKIVKNKKTKEQDVLYSNFSEIYNKIKEKTKTIDEIRLNAKAINNSIAEKLTRLERHKNFKGLSKCKGYPIVLTLNCSPPSVDNTHKQINVGLLHINSVEDFKSAVTEAIIENFIMSKKSGKLDVDCTKFESARYFIGADDLFRMLIAKGLYQCKTGSEHTRSREKLSIENIGKVLEDHMVNKMKKIADGKPNFRDVSKFAKMNEFKSLARDLLRHSIADYGDEFYRYIFIKEGRAALCMNYLNELGLVSQNSIMESLIGKS